MAKKGQFKAGATADSIRQRKYNGTAEQKKRRAERNASRKKVEKKVGKAALKGKDVDHKNKSTSDQSGGNLRVRSVKANRADNRGTGGRKKKGK